MLDCYDGASVINNTMSSNNYHQNSHFYPLSPPTRYASPTLSEQGSVRSLGSPPPAYQQPYSATGYNNNRSQLNTPTNRNSDTLSTFIPNAPILYNMGTTLSDGQSQVSSQSSSPHNSYQNGQSQAHSPTPSHATVTTTSSNGRPLPQRKSSLRAREQFHDIDRVHRPRANQSTNGPPPPAPTHSQSTPPRRLHSLRNHNQPSIPLPGPRGPAPPMPRIPTPQQAGIHEILEANEHLFRNGSVPPGNGTDDRSATPRLRQSPEVQVHNPTLHPPPRNASRSNPVSAIPAPHPPAEASTQSNSDSRVVEDRALLNPASQQTSRDHIASTPQRQESKGKQVEPNSSNIPELPQKSFRRPSVISGGGSPKSSMILDNNGFDPIVGGVQRKHNSYISTVPSMPPMEAIHRIDPQLMHVLISRAVAESKEFGVLLDPSELDEFKAEYKSLETRVRSLTESHAKEIRILHSAQDLVRMLEQQHQSGGAKISRSTSFRTRASNREMEAAHDKVREAEAQVRSLTTELWHAQSRMTEVQRRLLEHAAATLNVGMRRLDDGNKKLMQRVKVAENGGWSVPENVEEQIRHEVDQLKLEHSSDSSTSRLPNLTPKSSPDAIYIRMKALDQVVQQMSSKNSENNDDTEIRQLVDEMLRKKNIISHEDAQEQNHRRYLVEDLRELADALDKDNRSSHLKSNTIAHRLTMGSELRHVLDSSLLELSDHIGSSSSEAPSLTDYHSKDESSANTSMEPVLPKVDVISVNELQNITAKYEKLMEERETEFLAKLHEETSYRKKMETELEVHRGEVSKLSSVVTDLEGLVKSKQKDLDERDVRIEKDKRQASQVVVDKEEAMVEMKKRMEAIKAEKDEAENKIKQLSEQLETTNTYKNKQLPLPNKRANKTDTMSAFLTNYLDDSDEDEEDDIPALPSYLRSRSPTAAGPGRPSPSPNTGHQHLPPAVRSRPSYDLHRDELTNTTKDTPNRQNIPYGMRF
ncbi:hypothetical protein NQZ79_g8780 [Umbelopsis isabellina]|nr:hypothetical protein NQZ79_g8780 [Umbelopsis isabellina]